MGTVPYEEAATEVGIEAFADVVAPVVAAVQVGSRPVPSPERAEEYGAQVAAGRAARQHADSVLADLLLL